MKRQKSYLEGQRYDRIVSAMILRKLNLSHFHVLHLKRYESWRPFLPRQLQQAYTFVCDINDCQQNVSRLQNMTLKNLRESLEIYRTKIIIRRPMVEIRITTWNKIFWHINNWKLKIEVENIKKQNKKIHKPIHSHLRKRNDCLSIGYILQWAKYWASKAFRNTGKFSKIGRSKFVWFQMPEHQYIRSEQVKAPKERIGKERQRAKRKAQAPAIIVWD